jgi:hypothetical protein
METNEQEILEYAINNGFFAASEKYNLSKEAIYEIARVSGRLMDIPCDCEVARMKGTGRCCFFCYKDHPSYLGVKVN